MKVFSKWTHHVEGEFAFGIHFLGSENVGENFSAFNRKIVAVGINLFFPA